MYRYDSIPQELRVQIIHIWRDTLGSIDDSELSGRHRYIGSIDPIVIHRANCYGAICDVLCREYGVFQLVAPRNPLGPRNPFDQLASFIMVSTDVDKILDVIKMSFNQIESSLGQSNAAYYLTPKMNAAEAIQELNFRFREHSVGYQYDAGQIVRLDAEYIHSEITRPVINLLSGMNFSGTLDEFLQAHEHYRKNKYKECLNDCLKSFESCLKTICGLHKWRFDKNSPAKVLLNVVRQNNLIPSYLDCHYTSLWSVLESGVPTLRSKEGAHGQGQEIKTVPDYFAAYALHLTAASLLFFVKAHQNFDK